MPTGGELAERLQSVLHVLYLLFMEGYAASTGARVARSELSGETIRLTRMVHASLPDDPEVAGAARADAAQRGAPPRAVASRIVPERPN